MIEAKKVLDLVQNKLMNWLEAMVVMLPNLVMAVLIVVGFWLLAKLVRNVAIKVMLRFFESGTLQRLFANTLHVAIVLIGGFTALSVLHLDKTVTSLLAGVGILGLALGFAFQDIASNFIAGILMAAQRPLQPGDLVETGGQFGVVERIDLRTTQIRDLQGLQVIIPNKDIFQNVLVNYTRNGIRRVDLPIGLRNTEDLESAKQVTIDAVRTVPDVLLEKGVDLFFQEFASSSIRLEVRFWIASVSNNHFHKVRSEAIMAIVKAYRTNAIKIPYPIQTLDLGPAGEAVMKGPDIAPNAQAPSV